MDNAENLRTPAVRTFPTRHAIYYNDSSINIFGFSIQLVLILVNWLIDWLIVKFHEKQKLRKVEKRIRKIVIDFMPGALGIKMVIKLIINRFKF